MTAIESAKRRLLEPIDPASLVAFRIFFGLLMLTVVVRFMAHGWIDEYYAEPRVFFSYHGFEWVRPWPGTWMVVHFAIMAVLALMVVFGLFYRVSSALLGALFAYAHLIDKTNYLNHYYLLICLCFLGAFLPLHRGGSLDWWRNPALGQVPVGAWSLWALRAQIGLVYFFGGIAKLKGDWLLHAEPMQTWLAASTDFPVIGSLLGERWMAYACSWAGAAFDLTIVPLLLWRKSRPIAYVFVILFHLITARLFQLGMFPWIMIVSTLVFFPPDWPRRLASRLDVQTVFPLPVATNESPQSRPLVWTLLGLYFAFHLVMPLRHWAYPGNVLWTEQGYRFAWNVMLMEKDGSTEFEITEPSTGRQWTVVPTTYLTPYQSKMMSSQPDMILQFSRWLATEFERRGVHRPEVRVDALASLNGRPMARLIDPRVDLAHERDGLDPYAWTLDPPGGPPP